MRRGPSAAGRGLSMAVLALLAGCATLPAPMPAGSAGGIPLEAHGGLPGEVLHIDGERATWAWVEPIEDHGWYAALRTTALVAGLRATRWYTRLPSGRIHVTLDLEDGADRLEWQLPPDATLGAPALDLERPEPLELYVEASTIAAALEDGVVRLALDDLDHGLLLHVVIGERTGHHFTRDEDRFYEGYGFPIRHEKGVQLFDYNAWALLDRVVPPRGIEDEDALIRAGMFLARVLRREGWPRSPKWSEDYPEGDRFTAHSRSFASLVFLAAYLARKGHDPAPVYEALQGTLRFFHASFEDHLEDGTPYIAYSEAKKQHLDGHPSGVLNTHAHALHFAWLMVELSESFGDEWNAAAWRALVAHYHPGSRALFSRLYPGTRGRAIFPGLLNYALDADYEQVPNPAYNSISLLGAAAGYDQMGEREREWIDLVDRRERDDAAFLGRICRLFPAALGFLDERVHLSSGIHAGRLAERFARVETRPHDPSKLIVERAGRASILSNVRFTADWVAGEWEERDDAPFAVEVLEGDGRWTVYETGGRYEAMSDFYGRLALTLPAGPWDIEIERYRRGGWAPAEPLGTANGPRVELPVERKALLTLRRTRTATSVSAP